MAWMKVQFKEKEAWAELGPDGQLLLVKSRVNLRYSEAAGAKIYSGSPTNVGRAFGAPVELPPGVSADSAPAPAARGSGFGSAGSRTAAQAAAALASAKEQVAALAGTHMAFTDGACRGNPGPAGAGAVLKLSDGRVIEGSRSCGVATNNVGELTAISLAVDLLTQAGVPGAEKVVVFTDSQYAAGVLTKGWKAKANQELIGSVKAQLKKYPKAELRWVAGHVGVPENERADALANAACSGRR